MRRTTTSLSLTLITLSVLAGVLVAPAAQGDPVATTQPEVLAEIPHDPDAFTQGLELADSVLYEGTGLAGQSQLRTLDPATGQVDRAEPLRSPPGAASEPPRSSLE